MNILQVMPAVADCYGGPSRTAAALGQGFAACGHQALTATTNAACGQRLPVECGTDQVWRGVPHRFFPAHLGESLKFSPGLGRWLRANVARFDVVQIHGLFSYSCLAAANACRRAGVAYFWRPHGCLDPWSLAQRRLPKQVFRWAGLERGLRAARAIIYTTDAERDLAGESGWELAPGVVIGLGVDDAEDSPGPVARWFPELDGARYVLALGRLHEKKNLLALLAAFRASSLPGAGWKLVLAGDGDNDYRQRLENETANDEHILMTGWVEGDARAALLDAAALFAAPSHQENFGLGVAEAMARGCPVLVGRGVNLAEVVQRESAGWVTGADPEAIAAGLEQALASGAERDRRGKNAARVAAERFRWKTVVDQYLELYAA